MELTPDELVNPAVKWIQASELISNLPVLSGAVFLTNQKRFYVLILIRSALISSSSTRDLKLLN